MSDFKQKIYPSLLTVGASLLIAGCVTTGSSDPLYMGSNGGQSSGYYPSAYSSSPVYVTNDQQGLMNAQQQNLELERQIQEQKLRRLQLQNKQLKREVKAGDQEEAARRAEEERQRQALKAEKQRLEREAREERKRLKELEKNQNTTPSP